MVDDLGRRPQPHAGTDGAASLGEQGPHCADGTGDGGAVCAGPAGEHVVRGPVTEVHERGQEPVDEEQPVLRAGTDRRLPWPGRKSGLVPFVPQRAQPGHEFGDRAGREARDPPVADDRDRCTRRVRRPHGDGRRSGTRRLTAYRARARQGAFRGRRHPPGGKAVLLRNLLRAWDVRLGTAGLLQAAGAFQPRYLCTSHTQYMRRQLKHGGLSTHVIQGPQCTGSVCRA